MAEFNIAASKTIEIVYFIVEIKLIVYTWLIINVIYNLIIALVLIGVTGNCWKLQTGYKRIWLRPQGDKGFVQRQTTNEIKEFYMKAR